MKRGVICALVVLSPARAYSDGIAIVGGSPRAIGRAGAATVGDDGGGALLINPAAMARRETTRFQLGVGVVDDSVQWQSAAEAAPLSNGQAASQLAPLAAVIGAFDGWILGAGVMTAAVAERSLPSPSDARAELGSAYNYRYAGIAGLYRRDTVALGAARRVGDSLAFGLSVGFSQIRVREHRRIWAGFGGRDVLGGPDADVGLAFSAVDRFSTSVAAGVLFAPEGAPIELGASFAWAQTAQLDGKVSAIGNPPDGPSIVAAASPTATLAIRQPLTARVGGRYVGDRIVAELDGDLWIAPAAAEAARWSIRGIRVVDSSLLFAELWQIPSRISQRTHVALRAAIDAELVPGFLWATAGYAFSSGSTPRARLSPSFGDLGGHTLGLGLETTAGGITVTLGWSRMWSMATDAKSRLELNNPFLAGDRLVNPGTYDGSIDQIGVLVELELELSQLGDAPK